MDIAALTTLGRLLDEALDLPPDVRARWVDGLGAEYDPLKPRLRSLLLDGSFAGAAEFLRTLPKLEWPAVDDTAAESRAPGPGSTLGPYRVTREIAEGGMGTVWLAERTDGLINRPVALKLPRGLWSRAGLVERIARERNILAALDHPNIARLYDAGVTADGHPYLALEYVEGARIDEFARVRRLDLPARLRLFLQVVRAVAHAHGKLVIHRDLKPSNVLVSEAGDVKLLDFGIAKLLEEGVTRETALTEIGGRPLTLDYASPEQIAGEPLTVASDVYSLGVVLYELLTGRSPNRSPRDSRGAIEEAILHEEPTRPSEAAAEASSRRILRGDLDTIVLKALKKRPEERYATVNALGEDLERYLGGQPVVARPDTAWYRLSKFVRRNRLGVTAAVVVLLAVLGGAGLALWQAHVARVEQRRAEEVKAFIATIFRDADPYASAGKPLSAADLLKQATGRIYRSFDTRPELRVELLNLVGASLLDLQDLDAAEPVVSRTAADALRSLGPEHPQTLRARVLLTSVHRFRGRTAQMRSELDGLLPALHRSQRVDPEDLLQALSDRAHLSIDEGRYADAASAANEALAFGAARLGWQHRETAGAAALLALAYHFDKRDPEALAAGERAYRLTLAAYPGQPRHPRVIDVRSTYGRTLAAMGHLDQAIEQTTQALHDASEVFGPSSMMVGYFSQNLAGYAREAGEIDVALENGERSVRILTAQLAPDSAEFALAMRARGYALLAARRGAEALDDLGRALEGARAALGRSHARVYAIQVNHALALAYRGRLLEARTEVGDAVSYYVSAPAASAWYAQFVAGIVDRLALDFHAALERQQAALRMLPTTPASARDRPRVVAEIGINQVELGLHEAAVATLEEALAGFKTYYARVTPERADALVGLGRAWMASARYAPARSALEEADRFWQELDADNRWAGEAALWLGRCHAASGRPSEARVALLRAARILSRSPIPSDAARAALARAPG